MHADGTLYFAFKQCKLIKLQYKQMTKIATERSSLGCTVIHKINIEVNVSMQQQCILHLVFCRQSCMNLYEANIVSNEGAVLFHKMH